MIQTDDVLAITTDRSLLLVEGERRASKRSADGNEPRVHILRSISEVIGRLSIVTFTSLLWRFYFHERPKPRRLYIHQSAAFRARTRDLLLPRIMWHVVRSPRRTNLKGSSG